MLAVSAINRREDSLISPNVISAGLLFSPSAAQPRKETFFFSSASSKQGKVWATGALLQSIKTKKPTRPSPSHRFAVPLPVCPSRRAVARPQLIHNRCFLPGFKRTKKPHPKQLARGASALRTAFADGISTRESRRKGHVPIHHLRMHHPQTSPPPAIPQPKHRPQKANPNHRA